MALLCNIEMNNRKIDVYNWSKLFNIVLKDIWSFAKKLVWNYYRDFYEWILNIKKNREMNVSTTSTEAILFCLSSQLRVASNIL